MSTFCPKFVAIVIRFAACLSSFVASKCLLEYREPFSFVKKKFMACTSHVSHLFDSVHVLFCCVVLREKSRYILSKKSFLSHRFAATQWGQRSCPGTHLLYLNLAWIRKCSRAHMQGRK